MMECTFSNGADGESRVAARFGLDDESVCVGDEDTWDHYLAVFRRSNWD